MATQCFMPNRSNRSGHGSHSQLPHVLTTTTATTTSSSSSDSTITTTTTTTTATIASAPTDPTVSSTTTITTTPATHQILTTEHQIHVDSSNGNCPHDIPIQLPVTKVLLPAQVVLAQLSTEQQAQHHQQSVLLQALTSNSGQHFITLVPPGQEGENIDLQSTQAVPCVQYIDEGGGSGLFTTPNGHMTAYSVYNASEQPSMYTPHSAAYYNTTSSNPETYGPAPVVSDSPGAANGQVENSNNNLFVEQADVFNGIDENSSTDQECAAVSCYPNSRLSVETIKWLVDNYELAEGLSVPRSTMYNHYLKHCDDTKMEPLNAASFGKLIRSVFNGLKTRRLGTRGNSKYHYYGIRLKPSSPINKTGENVVSSTMKANSFSHVRRLKPDGMKLENAEDRPHSTNDSGDSRCDKSSDNHFQYLGNSAGAVPNVEIDVKALICPEGITKEHLKQFRDLYRKHCESILNSIISFQFADVETLWHSFWNKDENDTDMEQIISKPILHMLCAWKPVQEFVKLMDYQFYQNLVEVLIPEVLRPIPSSLTQAIRTFAKSLEGWLKSALADCIGDIVNIKLSAISAFAQTLRRYTSLNHLAQAARAVLQSGPQIKQMTADLNRVDFRSVQEQASWVCQCDDETVQKLLGEFRQTLQHHLWLEEWAMWLEKIVTMALEPYMGKPSYPKAARHFLLKWSFYSSLVIRDLTLRSAASFGSFHLLRLLYDEYMFYVIEGAIAKATGTSSIAVMGEYLCSGKPEELCNENDWSRSKKLNRSPSTDSNEDGILLNGCLNINAECELSSPPNAKRKHE